MEFNCSVLKYHAYFNWPNHGPWSGILYLMLYKNRFMLLFHVFPTKERFGIQRIDIFGEAAVSELRISLDGVSFDNVDTVVNNEKLNASL